MPDQTRLLVVDDDADIRELLSAYLARYDMTVETAADGAGLFEKLDHAHFDLIILDIMLPGEDGLSLCRRLRGTSAIPVIFLTSLDSSTDRVVGLELGADDYVVKPFDPRELLARIRTAVRHLTRINATNSTSHIFRASGLVIDFDRRRITVHEQEVHLTQVEYKIVSMLANNSGKVITYDALISHVWGPYADDNNRILRVNMANIRRKLERNPAQPEYIFTEIGIGYRMIDAET